MRWTLVMVGLVLIVIGGVLLFVPVVPQNDQKESVQFLTGAAYVENVSGYSITSSIPVAVSWSSNSSTKVLVGAGTCSSSCSDRRIPGPVTWENATGGSFTLNPPNGGGIELVVLGWYGPSTVTFKITSALGTAPTALIVVGAALLVLGFVLRAKGEAAPTQALSPAPAVGSPVAQPAPP